ncbi:TetR/AcrR family transcriptional regulator [Nocardioides plantarum]|uniref:TetR/AcrR family transcriptional regulator n=1 Tax=Nocardioides plantarum TaxID=29299 RepID=A0ABV5K4G1_9ACTN|nr:TetR/AcrR family transcriptional regulator [Nocardioides plantarum]
MRADAQRNRDRIVEVAREVFREQGYEASLDLIAKRAEVGAGTLYRHFPTRDDLIDAIMQVWVDRVTESTDKVLAYEGSDRDLLLRWFETYVELISLHKGGPAKITTAMGNPESPIRSKCQVLSGAAGRVMDALGERGALRPGVDAVQVCRLVGGVASVADSSGLDDDAVRPLLEVVADGMLARS